MAQPGREAGRWLEGARRCRHRHHEEPCPRASGRLRRRRQDRLLGRQLRRVRRRVAQPRRRRGGKWRVAEHRQGRHRHHTPSRTGPRCRLRRGRQGRLPHDRRQRRRPRAPEPRRRRCGQHRMARHRPGRHRHHDGPDPGATGRLRRRRQGRLLDDRPRRQGHHLPQPRRGRPRWLAVPRADGDRPHHRPRQSPTGRLRQGQPRRLPPHRLRRQRRRPPLRRRRPSGPHGWNPIGTVIDAPPK